MVNTQIKICGLKDIETLRFCESLNVNAIGLVFHPASARNIDIGTARQLIAAAAPYTRIVGLVMDRPSEDVHEILAQLPLDALQFHGTESAAYCEQFSFPYYKAVSASSMGELDRIVQTFASAKGLLIDSNAPGAMGGSGHTLDWQKFSESPHAQSMILAGGLTPGNVAAAIEQVRPAAVDVSSGVEQSKGIKSMDKIAAFVQSVREADAAHHG
ncbi:MAG: phosphoribosylanthranilate isomerase [Gammaproteobacteria bacterium]|nr:phosphoribosylanthranilate isomerase [Gammaproteobacteria bacterium]